MMKHAERGELDVIPPLGSVTITLYQVSLIRTGRPRQNPRVMEQACQTSFAIVNHIACDLKTTPRVSLSEIWYKRTIIF